MKTVVQNFCWINLRYKFLLFAWIFWCFAFEHNTGIPRQTSKRGVCSVEKIETDRGLWAGGLQLLFWCLCMIVQESKSWPVLNIMSSYTHINYSVSAPWGFSEMSTLILCLKHQTIYWLNWYTFHFQLGAESFKFCSYINSFFQWDHYL